MNKKRIKIFKSFEEENLDEHRRLRRLSPKERWRELAVLQERRWGKGWASEPIVKRAIVEKTSW